MAGLFGDISIPGRLEAIRLLAQASDNDVLLAATPLMPMYQAAVAGRWTDEAARGLAELERRDEQLSSQPDASLANRAKLAAMLAQAHVIRWNLLTGSPRLADRPTTRDTADLAAEVEAALDLMTAAAEQPDPPDLGLLTGVMHLMAATLRTDLGRPGSDEPDADQLRRAREHMTQVPAGLIDNMPPIMGDLSLLQELLTEQRRATGEETERLANRFGEIFETSGAPLATAEIAVAQARQDPTAETLGRALNELSQVAVALPAGSPLHFRRLIMLAEMQTLAASRAVDANAIHDAIGSAIDAGQIASTPADRRSAAQRLVLIFAVMTPLGYHERTFSQAEDFLRAVLAEAAPNDWPLQSIATVGISAAIDLRAAVTGDEDLHATAAQLIAEAEALLPPPEPTSDWYAAARVLYAWTAMRAITGPDADPGLASVALRVGEMMEGILVSLPANSGITPETDPNADQLRLLREEQQHLHAAADRYGRAVDDALEGVDFNDSGSPLPTMAALFGESTTPSGRAAIQLLGQASENDVLLAAVHLAAEVEAALGLIATASAAREGRQVETGAPSHHRPDDDSSQDDRSRSSAAVSPDRARENEALRKAVIPERYLAAELPGRAPTGVRVTLLVQILLGHGARQGTALRPFPVPAEGQKVTICVSAPELATLGDLEQEVLVPVGRDSDPVRFGFMTRAAGLHIVTVRAFVGGTFLGELRAELSVEQNSRVEEAGGYKAPIGPLAASPGEVTLQVSRTGSQYSFQLISETWYPVELSRRLAGDPSRAVEAIISELRAIAEGERIYASRGMVRKRLRNLGAQLWRDAVPEVVRRQFWDQAGRISSFAIASDVDDVPWELLYPVDGLNENGFLCEQFPVVRRVFGQGRQQNLALSSAVYVVPHNSPTEAIDEVTKVRARLGHHITDRGVLANLADLTALLDEAQTSILHFACHSQFTSDRGSVVAMAGGPFRPSDLSVAVQRKALSQSSPLIFFNSCRSAGEIPGLTRTTGWAKQFISAGAGAFIGSLWPVRSDAACSYADTFYQSFVENHQTLGQASRNARLEIANDEGDPTWLAYTIYGNPATTASSQVN